MQIQKLIFYNSSGEQRILPFELGKVNIISGESKTGKTALIDIINYCLGSDDCKISEGIIRDTVEWFAILLQLDNEQIFIARQNPNRLSQSSTQHIFLSNADEVEIPPMATLVNNSNISSLVEFLTKKLYISDYINTPETGTRLPLSVNFKHSRFYSFQPQDLVAQRSYLFYGQNDNFIAQSIKDTLPYFLGAIREDAIRIEQELAQKKRELTRKERELKEYERIKSDGSKKIFELVDEAKQLNLLSVNNVISDSTQALDALKQVLQWEENFNEVSEGENENLKKLLNEKNELTKELSIVNDSLKSVHAFINQSSDYSSEASQQKARLESINLFASTEANLHQCPLCNNEIDNSIPSINAINQSLNALSENLNTTVLERPKLNQYVEKVVLEQEELKRQIEIRQNGIRAIYTEQEQANKQRDENLRRGKVIGKISLFVESFNVVENDANLKASIETLNKEIANLEALIGSDEKESRINSILNQINIQMTSWSNRLDLEYKNSPIRFDIKKLTLFADTPQKSIPLNQLGSAANWVANHLLIHFALHKYFIDAQRPVPRFIIIDQPSQAYYPPDRDVTANTEVGSSDDNAVKDMYDFIFDVTSELTPNFQVIITDHAKLNNDRFLNSITEEWRNGQKLIPENWQNNITNN